MEQPYISPRRKKELVTGETMNYELSRNKLQKWQGEGTGGPSTVVTPLPLPTPCSHPLAQPRGHTSCEAVPVCPIDDAALLQEVAPTPVLRPVHHHGVDVGIGSGQKLEHLERRPRGFLRGQDPGWGTLGCPTAGQWGEGPPACRTSGQAVVCSVGTVHAKARRWADQSSGYLRWVLGCTWAPALHLARVCGFLPRGATLDGCVHHGWQRDTGHSPGGLPSPGWASWGQGMARGVWDS